MGVFISAIVPAFNAATTLPFCLKALQLEADNAMEILVVDDCSTDETHNIAHEMGIKVIQTPQRSGPSAARNLGTTHASGEILFFVDADVVVKKGAISIIRQVFAENPSLSATFGSYDDEPAEKNFLSQYKNLLHHYVHQMGNVDASTFWAGCGAIRKAAFDSVNGFNAQKYPVPSIEDIELGLRLKQQNHSIRLEKRLQGKHLKKWTIRSLLRADILHRAYPWSRLIAEMGQVPNELNVQFSHRISALLSGAFFGALLIGIFIPSWWIFLAAILFLGSVLVLNRQLYAFFYRRRGLLFLPGAILWHMLYYIYSAIIFVYCWSRFRTVRSEKKALHMERIV